MDSNLSESLSHSSGFYNSFSNVFNNNRSFRICKQLCLIFLSFTNYNKGLATLSSVAIATSSSGVGNVATAPILRSGSRSNRSIQEHVPVPRRRNTSYQQRKVLFLISMQI